MINQSKGLTAKAEEQWTSEVKIDARRGKILDRSGNELAVSANVFRVDLDMNTLKQWMTEKNVNFEYIAPKLSSALNMDEKKVLSLLNTRLPSGLPIGSITLKRRIEKAEADKVNELNIKGVLVSEDTQRYYPEGSFLAQVLGNTNKDGVGLNGIEYQYNKVLSGKPGVRIAETDSKSKTQSYTISDYTKPVDGKNLVLTIDSTIQGFCEKAAEQAVFDNKAKAVTIIAMDPKSGEILAMVNKPDFDPNNPRSGATSSDELQRLWRNRSVSDVFEPGSVFKVVTATAAMQENLVKENDTFVCNGSLTVANRSIHCWKTTGHGTQNFVDILKNSCNVGFMDLGFRLGAGKLNKYIKLFGFGTKTGIDLPGEAVGIVRPTQKYTQVDLATTSFGQGAAVSSVQYIAAFNAIANGGVWVRPHLMKEITHTGSNGEQIVDETYNNIGEKRIINADIDKTLTGYLEKVVSEGGGHNAFIDGYHIAGKTGTAQKISPTGGYAQGKYISSFGGMAPANDPKITLFVSIDEPDPSNYYAGQITAPVAKQVFNDIFNYLNIKVDASAEDVSKSMLKDVVIPNIRGLKKDDALKKLKESNLSFDVQGTGDLISDITPIPGYTVKEGTKIVVYTGNPTNDVNLVAVPDLNGYTIEKAEEILNSLGLKMQYAGDGLVSEQSILPGQKVSKGTVISLMLEDGED